MRAVRFDGHTVRFVEDAPSPLPAPGEALVRISRAGLGPADARAATPASGFVGTLGHELVGVVERIDLPPDAPASLRARLSLKGKRVVAASAILCGHCDMCRSGLSAHCRNRRVLGLAGHEGSLAEYACVPLANLYPVPDHLSDDHASLAPALGAALHLAHLVRSDARAFVTIVGDNLPALLAALALSTFNRSARLLGDRADRLAMCDRWGLKHRPALEAGRRQDQDLVIDASGTAAGLRLALQMVRPRGTIVLTAPGALFPFPPGVPLPAEPDPAWATPIDLSIAAANEVHLVGSREGSIADALAFMLEHPLDAPGLISGRFRLDRAVDALRAAADQASLKVIVEL